ncbi:hypothetical protein ACM55H_05340 [Flavobacterium sp. ZT3R17]|uniref:hypothetical protein n=1 Tax=Flavobacterium cryoconiti TaxID=3398736 RepID=UPI003A88BC19
MQLMHCLASNDEVGLIVFEKNLSLLNAIDGTKLNKLEKSVGEINTITAICYLLNRFNSNFNVGKSLTQQQSALLASDIVEKYPYETIEDVVLMLKQVRQGILGDGKDYKLDGQNVLAKWFPEYLEKKYIEFERIKKKENSDSETEKNIRSNAVHQFYEKRKAEKARKEKEEKIHLEIDEMIQNMDRQMLEDTISHWEKQEEMKPFLNYLREKRLVVKGDYKF